MKYIEDKDYKYRDILGKHLRSYNLKYTGNREFSSEYFYAIKDNVLVGAIYTNLFWDWVNIDSLFYKDKETLKKLISEIKHFYLNRAVGIKFITEVESDFQNFKKLGFELVGIMEGTPKTPRSFHMRDVNFEVENNNQKDIIYATEKINYYDSIVQEQIDKFNKENNINNLQEKDMIFVAIEDSDFAGGIQINITEDSMYINRLVVNEVYRGNRIGTKLMNIIEEKAKSLGVYSISTGTVEFQAKEFYEKQGYEVVMIKENDPKGFDSYKLTKKL